MKVTANLYEKHGKYHVGLSWQEQGKRKRKSIALGLDIRGNKRNAQKRMEEIRAEWEEKLDKPETTLLFSDYLMQWLERRRPDLAETTYLEYQAMIGNRISPWFQKRRVTLSGLKAHHIDDFYQYKLNVDGVKPNTVRRYHACIRKALEDAFKLERIPENPAKKVSIAKGQRFNANFLTESELCSVLCVAKGNGLETPVLLTVWYGFRRGEVLGLRWKDIDFTEKIIHVNGSITDRGKLSKKQNLHYKTPKTESSIRSFPLLPPVEQYLKQLKKKQAENRLLCGSGYNQKWLDYICVDAVGDLIPPGRLTKSFPRLCEKNGLRRVRFHDLRHSCGSLLLAKGAVVKEIQSWLGHANYQLTADTYLHVLPESKEKLAHSLPSVLFESVTG